LAAALALLAAACNTDANRDDTRPDQKVPPGIQPTSGAVDVYDIRPLGTHLVNGATWNTAKDFSVGTGVLKPFLRIQDGANDFNSQSGNEEGFNTDGDRNYDQKNDPSVHSLALNHVPVVKIGGVFYREMIFDANESNSDPDANFSIDLFDLWLCKEVTDSDAAQFENYNQFDETSSNTNCKRVYSIDDNTGGPGAHDGDWIQASDASSKGSGSAFDYQILIPDANFLAAAAGISGFDISNCAYAGETSAPCGAWLLLKLKAGYQGGDFVTGSTFEEVSVLARPFVVVEKTAVPTYKRTYNWLIEKSVDPTTITLFEGQNQNATWSITVTPGSPAFTDSDIKVDGVITITNTSGAAVTINSVADAIAGYPGITPSCGVTFPHVLASGTPNNPTELECTYTVVAPNANPGAHTNTATVEIEAKLDPDDNVQAAVFTGSANFNFASVTPVEIDKDPNVYDNYNGEGEALIDNFSDITFPYTYVKNYECDDDEGSYSNTARVDLTSPRTDPTASANLVVDCLDVTVTKTSDETLTRTYKWKIDKTVTPATWELFKNDKGTSDYIVTVTPDGFEDNVFATSGVITITGDANKAIYIQSPGVRDTITTALNAAVTDCEDNGSDVTTPLVTPYTLAAGHVLTCDYARSLPDGTTRTNTAYIIAKPTSTGTNKQFTGTASVDFTGAQKTEVNKTVTVDDTYSGGPQDQTVSDLVDPTEFKYSRDFTCDADGANGGKHDNTATIKETNQSASASVTVTCRIVRIEKNAITSFDRDFNWDILKTTTAPDPVLLSPGQTYGADYKVEVTKSSAIDSKWHVTGTIRIAHNHTTKGALLNSLSDVVTTALAAAITGCNIGGTAFTFPGTVGVGEQLRCTYDRDLTDATSRTNTATTVQQNHSYASDGTPTATGTTSWATSAVAVTFGSPTNVTDNCADVDDTFNEGPDENICASKTYNYTHNIVAPEGVCTDFQVNNTASVKPTTDPEETDDAPVNIDVQCPLGCTLTLGYWKTHNATFKGGAPVDATWELLPLKELSGFFTNTGAPPSYPLAGPNALPAFTWFNVFWTSPGGNAYYQLSQQYMAAKLNILNGADPSAVNAAITTAETLFSTLANTPAAIGALSGNNQLRKQFVNTAGTLGSYNEGKTGPGHCTEDRTSLLTLVR
jgi:hypothetical protein